MDSKSKLHPRSQSGVVVTSGPWGLGKSMLAFTAEQPDQTAILDFDLKGEQMARDYSIRHCAAPNVVSGNPADYDVKLLAEWSVQQIQAIPDGATSHAGDREREDWESGRHKCPALDTFDVVIHQRSKSWSNSDLSSS